MERVFSVQKCALPCQQGRSQHKSDSNATAGARRDSKDVDEITKSPLVHFKCKMKVADNIAPALGNV